MSRHFVLLILTAFLGALLPVSSLWAQTDAGAAVLQRIQDAARTLNYEGVFAYQQNDQMQSFKIAHRFDGKSEQERLEAQDNLEREFIRHDGTVSCVIPEREIVLVEPRRRARFPALLMSDPVEFSEYYDLVRNPKMGRIAARSCVELDIVPKDGFRPRFRLCADEQTGLLLKAQVLDPSGRVNQQVAFSEIVIGQEVSDATLQSKWSTDSWKKVSHEQIDIDFDRLGWAYDVPPGYHVSQQTRRVFQDGREVDQLILTDGLASISVFIEPYQDSLSHHHSVGIKQSGSVQLMGRRLNDSWVMVVGDVPSKSLQWVADSIKHVQP